MATAGDAEGAAYAISFIEGKLPEDRLEPSPAMASRYAEASPIHHVNPKAPPTLLIHGDADRTVPYSQSVTMEAAMARVGAELSLLTIPGGVHAPDFGAGTSATECPPAGWPDYLGRMTAWFDEHLEGRRR
jgi:dipeptidyl aminopeptidase/acylaminoacyl peptidase